MNKYNNPRLLNAVVSGTGMKHPIQPHVVVGDVSNGFIRGDLMDANAIVDLVNSGDAIDQETIRQAVADIIGTAPENLDTLGEVAETLIDMQDATKQGSLAYKIAAIESELDEENVDSFASKINSTIEDNELTIAAALNDLNSRLLELVTRVDALDGGGDTPQETRFAISISSDNNRYVVGVIRNNIAYIDVTNENDVMLMNGQGVFSNVMTNFGQYKEQFITKISSDVEPIEDIMFTEVTGITIGDDYPGFDNLPKYDW